VYLPDANGILRFHAYIEFKDSMIRYSLNDGKEDYFYRVSMIYKIGWTGLCEGKTQNSSAYCAMVQKMYWLGRVDQFYCFELCPGKLPKLVVNNDLDMQARARQMQIDQEVADKLQWDCIPK